MPGIGTGGGAWPYQGFCFEINHLQLPEYRTRYVRGRTAGYGSRRISMPHTDRVHLVRVTQVKRIR